MRGIEGKIALVTGGAGGIGAAVARRLVSEGAQVALLDVDASGVRARGEELGIPTYVADVTSESQVEAAFEALDEALGPVDALVHVAAIYQARSLLQTTSEAFGQMLAVNVKGAFHCLRAAARRMMDRRSGTIVTVASQSSKIVRFEQGEYGASKAASAYLTKALGLELAPHGIRCNVVHPGVTDTPMAQQYWNAGIGSKEAHVQGNLQRHRAGIPLRKVATSEEIAAVCAFLVSDDASHITMEDVLVDGGASMLA
jgi:2,3-dihydro-2,3-dihydroxybenzoate dehydrogenase